MSWAQCMSNVGVLIMNNKLVTFLSVALFAFVITVIALSGSNNTNAADLDECRARLDELLSATTTTVATTTTLAPTTTVAPTTTTLETTTTVTPPPGPGSR